MLLSICLIFCSGPDLSRLDRTQFEIHELNNSFSPTALLFKGESCYLAADLLEPQPGIYLLARQKQGGFNAGLVQFLPQQAIEGLSLDSNGLFCVASNRMFSPFDHDWANQLTLVDMGTRQVVERAFIDTPNTCPDGTVDCGIVGAWPRPDGTWIAVTKQGLPSLLLLVRERMAGDRPGFKVARRLQLKWSRKYPVITDFQIRDDQLIFLLRDRWLLATANLASLQDPTTTTLDLETAFDFSSIKPLMALVNTRLSFGGIAEGFDFDAAGNLYILCNNRGFAFRNATGEVGVIKPRLVIFAPVKSAP